MEKKLQRLYRFFFVLVGALYSTGYAVAGDYKPQQYNAGHDRLFEVLYTGPGGVHQVGKKTKLADTKNILQDLNLLEIARRFDAQTEMGKVFIIYTLDRVVSPKDTTHQIMHRQNMIKLLMASPDLQTQFESLIKEAVEHEKVLIKFLKGKKPLMSLDDVEDLPSMINFYNEFKKRNVVLNTYDQLSSITTVASMLSPSDRDGKFGNDLLNGAKKVIVDDAKISMTGLSLLVSFMTLGASAYYNLTANPLTETLPFGYNLGVTAKNNLQVQGAILGTIASAIGLFEHYSQALSIRDSLYSLNRLVTIGQQIDAVCRHYGIDNQFKISSMRSPKAYYLLENLAKYDSKDSNFVVSPLVHSFVYDIYEHDELFAPVYGSIAEMDGYLAIAKKMMALQDQDNQLCFAEFLDEDKPNIRAEGFWNMLVSKGDVITNSIAEDRNIILTGSNEGGKTTSIRAILQNIVLAQTFGIAAGRSFALTPFDALHSYLNISDDILNAKSRFASELKQAQDILKKIKSLPKDEKFFFAFDELFTGTNGEDGAACAYGFINNVASYSGIQFIYATHFNKLKEMEAFNPSCVNYKIEPPLRDAQGNFVRDDFGQLIYPYKLSKGANDTNVAMERAKDAGIFI